MGRSRREMNNQKWSTYGKKSLVAISSLLMLSLSVGGTLAYIAVKTNSVDNQFVPAEVTCRVNTYATNSTIDVTNTSNIDAYIRAAIAVNWMDSDGNVLGTAPKSPSEYELELGTDNGWTSGADGYYYYFQVVTPEESDNDTTADLVEAITVNVEPPNGYKLSVEVVAEAIQADGVTDDEDIPAYQDVWDISGVFEN